MSAELGLLLRMARAAQRISQLELSLRLGVSQRHVSFVELGRSRPGRDLVLAWMDETSASQSLCNAALLKAGYAPLSPGATCPGVACEVAFHTIELHHPNPGIVFDADWYIVRLNAAARWLCALAMPDLWKRRADDRIDMITTLAHPDGWLARARRPDVIAGALLGQLRAEQWLRPSLSARIDHFEAAARSRYGAIDLLPTRDPIATSFEVSLETDEGWLSFCAVQSRFGLAQDAGTSTLRAELWFPSDDATSQVLHTRRHAMRQRELAMEDTAASSVA